MLKRALEIYRTKAFVFRKADIRQIQSDDRSEPIADLFMTCFKQH